MTNDDELTDEHLRAIAMHYAPEVARIKRDAGPPTDRASLFDLAAAPEVPPATLVEALLADPVTARLLGAWRRSVLKLEAARAEAVNRGDDVSWLDIDVTAANDRNAE